MVTLADAKQHLRVDGDDEDATIDGMIEAAVDHLASIGCDMQADPMPAALTQAALMLVAHFYDTRGLEADGVRLSPVFMRLVAPYREVAL